MNQLIYKTNNTELLYKVTDYKNNEPNPEKELYRKQVIYNINKK